MKRKKILKILEKYHVSYDIAFTLADELQTKELTNEEINNRFPTGASVSYLTENRFRREGAKWYREQIK